MLCCSCLFISDAPVIASISLACASVRGLAGAVGATGTFAAGAAAGEDELVDGACWA